MISPFATDNNLKVKIYELFKSLFLILQCNLGHSMKMVSLLHFLWDLSMLFIRPFGLTSIDLSNLIIFNVELKKVVIINYFTLFSRSDFKKK